MEKKLKGLYNSISNKSLLNSSITNSDDFVKYAKKLYDLAGCPDDILTGRYDRSSCSEAYDRTKLVLGLNDCRCTTNFKHFVCCLEALLFKNEMISYKKSNMEVL